jgi:hypothetical protein
VQPGSLVSGQPFSHPRCIYYLWIERDPVTLDQNRQILAKYEARSGC